MALIECKECQRKISSEAKACPGCGAEPERTGCLRRCFYIFLALMAVSAAIRGCEGPDKKPQTNEQLRDQLNKEKQEKINNERFQKALLGKMLLKKSMRDPDSFVLESAIVMEKTNAVCYEYRSRNGFGGMNSATAVFYPKGFKTSEQDGFSRAWNKYCAHKSGENYAKQINTVD